MATAAPPRATPAAAQDRANISRVPYLPGLDGMRALAVIAVMVYHANVDWLKGGFFGVEVFFVISGYLITLLLIAEKERTDRVDMKQFWMRRGRRLLPALFVMMLMVSRSAGHAGGTCAFALPAHRHDASTTRPKPCRSGRRTSRFWKT